MISVEQWERGEVKLTDERFKAVWDHWPWSGWYVSHYVGEETGTVISGHFADVFEGEGQ